MKKYDWILLGVYMAILIVAGGILREVTKQEYQTKVEVKNYIEALYQKPVRTVIIQNTSLELTIKKKVLPQGVPRDFALTGSLFVREAEAFKVQGDTLNITDKKRSVVSSLTLLLSPEVKIDTIMNAPHVEIDSSNVK